MSGTRSHSPPEPATRAGSEALLIVAHGDCGGPGGDMLAQELARRMRQTRCYDEVAIGFMRSQPLVEEVVSHITSDNIRLYPLFMSDGSYVRDAIPKRLGITDGVDALGHRVSIDEPLGLHPKLPELLMSAAAGAALGNGIQPKSASLLLVAHGSSLSPHSGDVARHIRDCIARGGAFSDVEVSFLEEAPFFADALGRCVRPTFVLGLFAGGGMHAADDVRGAVIALGNPQVHVVEQLGGYAGIIELVTADLGQLRGTGNLQIAE